MRPRLSPSITASEIALKRSKFLAMFVAFVLAVGAPVFTTSAAQAAAATLTATTVPTGGGSITINGSGYDPINSTGYLLAIAPANYASYEAANTAGALVSGSTFLIQPGVIPDNTVNPKVAALDSSGAFAISVTIPAATASGWRAFVTSAANPLADTTVRSTILNYSVAPSPQISFSLPNGASTLEPSLTTAVTVSGTGFVAQGSATSTTAGYYAPALLSGDFGGVYVVFGKFRTGWQPSLSGASSLRTSIAQKWAVAPANFGTGALTSQAGAIALNADGSFSTTLNVTITQAQDLLAGVYGIYTYGGGNSRYAPFETFTPVTVNPYPVVSVSAATTSVAEGTVVTVSGSGFSARGASTNATRPPLSGSFGGVYVVFGKFRSGWQPSLSGTSSLRTAISTKWAVLQSQFNTVGGANAGAIVVDANGNWSTTVTLSKTTASELATGNYGIYTYGGGGMAFAPFETYTPVTFQSATPTVTPTPTTTVTAEPEPTGIGYISWGIDSGFRDYILGNIAQGNISVSAGATASGATYNFGQSGKSFNFTSRTGSAEYAGSIRFYGHSGALDLTFANPTVIVDSASTGTLYVSVNGSRVAFGTVNLAAAGRGESGGAQLYTNAPVTLTSAGASAFNGFYTAGRQLSPITFQIGLNGAAPAGSVGTISMVASIKKFVAPATPPAKTGISAPAKTLNDLSLGKEVTLTIDGFQPNETGIAVVVYSTPTVLAENLTADANGVVTWTGKLPESLESGNHTLTIQGSVAKGVGLTITKATERCTLSQADLTWGFKESFLAYLDSSIANGAWELSGVDENTAGEFIWTTESGELSEEFDEGNISFPGSILFTGHNGTLSTTIGNPELVFTSTTSAELYLDVTGSTQGGTAVSATAVKFATVEWDEAASRESARYALTNGVVTLTGEGATAFGTYPAGEILAPLTVSADLECATNVAAAKASNNVDATENSSTWIWVVGALILAAASTVTFVIIRRRRNI